MLYVTIISDDLPKIPNDRKDLHSSPIIDVVDEPLNRLRNSCRGLVYVSSSDQHDPRCVGVPCWKGVNLKSGKSPISLSLDAGFRYCPSALEVSNCNRKSGSAIVTLYTVCSETAAYGIFSREIQRRDDGIGDLLDRDLFILPNCKKITVSYPS